MRKIFATLILFALPFVSEAMICRGFVKLIGAPAKYHLRMGDLFEVQFASGSPRTQVHFLGASRLLNKEIGGYFFFDPQSMEIHYVPRAQMTMMDNADVSVVPDAALEPVVRSINQEGGTCAAFAIFNCLHQLLAMDQIGNGSIVHRMVDEPARAKLLMRVENEYYGDDSHVGAESELANELGYVISDLNSASPRDLADSIRHSSKMGWPMMIRFDVGSAMSQTPYTIKNHGDGTVSDRRLWLPKTDSGRYGGHQIMLARSFVDYLGREWLLVVDSNWQAPRLWAIDELNRAQLAGIRGWTAWQNTPNPKELPPAPRTPFIQGEGGMLEPETLPDPTYPREF